jgi:hypothetical protein
MGLSSDVAPAFAEQARRWLNQEGGRPLADGIKERLETLLWRYRQDQAEHWRSFVGIELGTSGACLGDWDART